MDTSCKLNRFGNYIFNFENISLGVALKHIVLRLLEYASLIRINKSISIFFYFSLKFKKTMTDDDRWGSYMWEKKTCINLYSDFDQRKFCTCCFK